MYIPSAFQSSDLKLAYELIEKHPLATIVTYSDENLNANHIPLKLRHSPNEPLCLVGHVAKANGILQDIMKSNEVLCVFKGPDSYISPSWYATKKTTGNVVPTWNFSAVHIYGKIKVIDDKNWLNQLLDEMVTDAEKIFPNPWKVSEASPEYYEKLLELISGISIQVDKMEAKFKFSQNQPIENVKGVIDGLSQLQNHSGEVMSQLVYDFNSERIKK